MWNNFLTDCISWFLQTLAFSAQYNKSTCLRNLISVKNQEKYLNDENGWEKLEKIY